MSKIQRIELMLLDLKPKVKRVDAIQAFTSQETPIIRICTDDGAEGVGYTYTIGTGGRSVVAMLEAHLAPLLIGRDPAMIEQIWHDLMFHTHATAVGAITSLALCAIDTALWDLRCRRSGQPLYREAGGARDSLPLYTTEGGWLHLEASALVEDAVREAVGPDFEIMVDANQAFQVDEAIRRARLYEPFDLAWFEEPLPAEDLGGHIRLCRATTLPVAVGESIYSIGHFREYMQREACSVVQVDVARIGGITPWLKVAHMAEAFNIPVCPHFLMELHVALAAAVPNGRWVEYIPQLDELTQTGMTVREGRAVPSAEPGLGIAWDWEKIGRMRQEQTTRTIR
jgi:L-alanine-DL-glutamate epimerase-like enolase superfamily enzyme